MESLLATSDPSLYTLHVSKLFGGGSDAQLLFQDIARMVCIQIMIQAGFALSHPDRYFWSAEFVAIMLYIVLGVMFYWLVLRRLVTFK